MGKVNRKDSKGRVLRTGEYERANHTYEYRYSIKGVRYSEYAETLNELRKKEEHIKKKSTNGIDAVLSSQITVCDLAQRYLNAKKKLAPGTRYNYQRTLNNYLQNSEFGKMKAENVKKTDIIAFYDSFVDKNGRKKSGSIMMVQRLLQPSFEMGIDDNIILKNPCKGVFRVYPLEFKTKHAFTEEEEETFLEFMKNDRYYCSYYHMIKIMLGTGLRFGETIGLTWKDVDLKKKTIDINHQLLYKNFDHTHMKFSAGEPKSKSGYRVLYMSNDVYESFKILKKRKMVENRPIVTIDGYRDFVFTTTNGTPIQPNSFDRMLKKCASLCNEYNLSMNNDIIIPNISAHVLRHTACTRMAESGIDPKTLQYIMGHSSISITLGIYDHVNKNRVKNAFEKMDTMREQQAL